VVKRLKIDKVVQVVQVVQIIKAVKINPIKIENKNRK